jgi:Bacterial type II and III secretion system protein
VIRHMAALLAAIALTVLPASRARAQQPAPAQPVPARPPASPPQGEQAPILLKVQVVISRYQGDKKISSQPYMLTVTVNSPPTSLRMGSQVAVPVNLVPAPSDGKSPQVSYNYRDVGISIDCTARSLDDGRFRLVLSMDDNSVMTVDDQGSQPLVKGMPQFRSFRISNETTVLRDGQTAQVTTATEKVTGETARVDVTLNVVK